MPLFSCYKFSTHKAHDYYKNKKQNKERREKKEEEMEVENKFIAITEYISGLPPETSFEIKNKKLSLALVAGSNDVAVKILYVSIDPYQVNRMKKFSSSQTTVNFGARLHLGEVCVVYRIMS